MAVGARHAAMARAPKAARKLLERVDVADDGARLQRMVYYSRAAHAVGNSVPAADRLAMPPAGEAAAEYAVFAEFHGEYYLMVGAARRRLDPRAPASTRHSVVPGEGMNWSPSAAWTPPTWPTREEAPVVGSMRYIAKRGGEPVPELSTPRSSPVSGLKAIDVSPRVVVISPTAQVAGLMR